MFELEGVYPANRSITLTVETCGLGIAVLGTDKLTEKELRTVAEIMMVELNHRKTQLNEAVKRLEAL